MRLNKELEREILARPDTKVGPSVVLPPAIPTPTPAAKASGPPPPPPSLFEGSVHALWLPGWHPWALNKLLGHWAERKRRKARDRDIIANAVACYGTPQATKKRKVELILVLAKGKRRCDDDAMHKSLLDALVHANALVNDSPVWCQIERPKYLRVIDDAVPGTLIVLTDL